MVMGNEPQFRECVTGRDQGCLSIRCGSDCSDTYDRMHPCLACVTWELGKLRMETGKW